MTKMQFKVITVTMRREKRREGGDEGAVPAEVARWRQGRTSVDRLRVEGATPGPYLKNVVASANEPA